MMVRTSGSFGREWQLLRRSGGVGTERTFSLAGVALAA